MAYVASQLIEEVTAHAQSDSLEDAREICADGTYFPNNLRTNSILIQATRGMDDGNVWGHHLVLTFRETFSLRFGSKLLS